MIFFSGTSRDTSRSGRVYGVLFARRQGAYSVVAATGLILKRGHELDRVLKVIDKPLRLVS